MIYNYKMLLNKKINSNLKFFYFFYFKKIFKERILNLIRIFYLLKKFFILKNLTMFNYI